ncbi:HEAT repeat domain-containing protein [Flavobacterium sp. TMP13]|uniref:HEAT repeat domain-containing protein n=1 Tax=Flavobacterium sp. TMP13 TaxID=3425950 RepID=UPI003D76D3EB
MILEISFRFLFDTFLGVLVVVFLMIVAVLYFSLYQFKKLILLLKWSTVINDKVLNAIVYDGDFSTSADNLEPFSENSSFRDLFLEKLVESEKKFSGAANEQINKLFTDYKLEKEAFNKIYQKKPSLIAGGIKELSAMRVQKALPNIAVFLTHASPIVYQEAQYAMINLKGFDGLNFLNTIPNVISEWQQLRLLLSITDIPSGSEESIDLWLRSENDSVVIFTLRLLRKFQLLSLYSSVLNLFNHRSDQVRIQAVETVQSLENSTTIQHLTDSFKNQSEEVQVEIVRILKTSKDPRSIEFLKEQLTTHSLVKLRIFAAEALLELDQKEYLITLRKDSDSSDELVQIINHSIQEKIC